MQEYEGASEFISNKINELCSEQGISTEEVRLYILKIKRLETYCFGVFVFMFCYATYRV